MNNPAQPQTIGKFELLRLLGQGTMGRVFLARDSNLGREVALKSILPGNAFGEESRARFQVEARAMAALNHPNIVTLFEAGEDQGTDYLVMEFLDGEDLGTLIERGQLGRAEQLEALAQACEGLGFAHSRGVVHRDVKPGNILVLSRNGRIQAKLTDFGIAALSNHDLAQQDGWVGTVSYMAPEYLESGQASAGADLFAAGVILYEILASGRRPFTGDTTPATLAAILRQPPPPLDPQELKPFAAMLPVLARALAKDPAERYPDAEALAAAIRAVLTQAVTQATPQPPPVQERPPEPPRPVVVGRGGAATCLSLRLALRQAAAEAVIQVLPGTYQGTLLVDRPLTIQGLDDAEVIQFPDGIVVAPGVTLTLAQATVGSAQDVALRLRPGARLEARDVAFRGGAAGGVELEMAAEGSFLRCRFTDNGSAGLLVLEDARAFLEDCQLSGNQDAGVHAGAGASLRLLRCRLQDNQGLGLAAVDGAAVAMEHCEWARNQGPGLLLHRGASARLEHCELAEGPSLGIVCRHGASLVMGDSQIQGNLLGGILLGEGALAPALGPDNRILDPVIQGS